MSPSLSPLRTSVAAPEWIPTCILRSLDYVVPHDLDGSAARSIGNRRTGTDTPQLRSASIDARANIPNRNLDHALTRCALAELGFLIDLGRHEANPTRQLACVSDLNPSSLTRRKLRDMSARYFSLEFNFSVDCDHEEWRLCSGRKVLPMDAVLTTTTPGAGAFSAMVSVLTPPPGLEGSSDWRSTRASV